MLYKICNLILPLGSVGNVGWEETVHSASFPIVCHPLFRLRKSTRDHFRKRITVRSLPPRAVNVAPSTTCVRRRVLDRLAVNR